MSYFNISSIDEQEPLPGNDVFSNEIDYEDEQTYPRGTRFWQIYQGRTATGYGQVSKIWEVDAYLSNGNYECKPISDNTLIKVNPEFTETFNEIEIEKILKDVPLL